MINITEFIERSREERRAHLDLEESCCERGGNSTNHKGVLAQYLDTTIPSGRILLCHACNNGKCSNPKHLYWGTDYDNVIIDGKEFGTFKSPFERRVEKYGYEKACAMNSRVGNTFGSGNKNKPKSEEHKKKIAESVKKKHNDGSVKNKAGRKAKTPYDELLKLVAEHGIPETAKILNQSYDGVRSRYYSAKKNLTNIL
jgi:hypothetical protein